MSRRTRHSSAPEREMGEFADVFEAGVLPASIEVHLRSGMGDPATVKSVADRIRTYHFIDDVRYGEEWVAKLYRLRNIATVAGLALGVAFAAVAIIIIGATIRVTVSPARRRYRSREAGRRDRHVQSAFPSSSTERPGERASLGPALALVFVWIANRVINEVILHPDDILQSGNDLRRRRRRRLHVGVLGSLVSVGRHLRRV